MTREKNLNLPFVREDQSVENHLILYNDDVNTFEYVIDCLVELCDHEPEQAEQCTLIVHFKGKCAVKTGSFYDLKPIHDEMCNRQLSVSIH